MSSAHFNIPPHHTLVSCFYFVTGSGTESTFLLGDILTRKELVLSTMQAAVLNGGSISLDLYLRVHRALPAGMCDGVL